MANEVLEVEFPVSARELETKLHAYCDHHGWDTIVLPAEDKKEVDDAD